MSRTFYERYVPIVLIKLMAHLLVIGLDPLNSYRSDEISSIMEVPAKHMSSSS